MIHHVVTGQGQPPIVFVHGFGCALSDWDAQVRHFSPRHQTVAVDLPGHGKSPAPQADCSIERFAADVVALMQALALPPVVLVGHSMGCRIVTEAALRAPTRTGAVVLVDGSQFAAAMQPVLQARFATPDGYASLTNIMFQDMFTPRSDPVSAARVIDRAARLPRQIGEALLSDMLRYDVAKFTASLGRLPVPVLAVQTTYSNEQRERRTMQAGQTTPYLDMLRAAIPSVRVEIIADTGHFPQLDESDRTNTLIENFLATLKAPVSRASPG